MFQVLVAIGVLLVVMGLLFVISLSRKEGRELQKSCGCNVTGEKSSCVSSCD